MIASVFGLSPALGPILGTAAAAIVAGDPRGIIWNRAGAKPVEAASTTKGRPVQTPV